MFKGRIFSSRREIGRLVSLCEFIFASLVFRLGVVMFFFLEFYGFEGLF